MTLPFMLQTTGAAIDFQPQRVLIAGYTGRNQEAVRAHIAELAAHGVPAPAEVPTLFRTTLDRLVTTSAEAEVEVLGGDSSGEAEAVLLVKAGEIWVALGSDHTDREVEKYSIPVSKQICPKPVSREVWRYAEVRERWDQLILRSWVGTAGREQLYQEGRLAALLPPEEILFILRRRVGDQVDGALIYTGTLALIGGKFITKPYFEAELLDEATGRALRCAYRARRVDS